MSLLLFHLTFSPGDQLVVASSYCQSSGFIASGQFSCLLSELQLRGPIFGQTISNNRLLPVWVYTERASSWLSQFGALWCYSEVERERDREREREGVEEGWREREREGERDSDGLSQIVSKRGTDERPSRWRITTTGRETINYDNKNEHQRTIQQTLAATLRVQLPLCFVCFSLFFTWKFKQNARARASTFQSLMMSRLSYTNTCCFLSAD